MSAPTRFASAIVSAILFALAMSGCGGGSSSGSGGGGEISISALAPSSAMVGIPVGVVSIYGQGLSDSAQVLINGQPVSTFFSSGILQAELDSSINTTIGTYQFSVQNGGNVSNSLPYMVYAPQQGTFEMQAVAGFLVGEGETDAPFLLNPNVNPDIRQDNHVKTLSNTLVEGVKTAAAVNTAVSSVNGVALAAAGAEGAVVARTAGAVQDTTTDSVDKTADKASEMMQEGQKQQQQQQQQPTTGPAGAGLPGGAHSCGPDHNPCIEDSGGQLVLRFGGR